jgi:hypothetical protein
MKTSYILVITLGLLIAFAVYSFADNIKQSYIKTGYDIGFDEGYKNTVLTIIGKVKKDGGVKLFEGNEIISLTRAVENDKSDISAVNADASVLVENSGK